MKLSTTYFYAPIFWISTLSGVVLPSATHAAAGGDIGFKPRLEIGVADYSLDVSAAAQEVFDSQITSAGKLSFGDVMPVVGTGITVFADQYFLDFAVQRTQTLNQNLSDSHTVYASSPSSLQITETAHTTDDFTRDEYTVSLGYGITQAFSVYVGYKQQHTDIKDLIGTGPIEAQFAGASTPLYGTFDTFTNIKFDYDGPFAGVTTGWMFDKGVLNGVFSVNAAMALFDGTLRAKDSRAFLTLNGSVTPSPITVADLINTDGETVGITLGATWLGKTDVAGLSYTASLNSYRYEFESDTNGRPDIEESVLQFKLGLAYAL